MKHLSTIATVQALQPFLAARRFDGPKRKQLDAPADRGLFIKPLKQCFVTNPRLMPGTRIMLAMIAGWAGRGGPIETTLGIFGKHVGRSARQVQRYLKDAIEEGYLRTSYVKDRIGRVTGLRINLTRLAIFHENGKRTKAVCSLATTPVSTNKGIQYKTNCWEHWLTRQTAWRDQIAWRSSTAFDNDKAMTLLSKGKELLKQRVNKASAACKSKPK